MVITEQMLSPYIGTSKLLESIDYLTEDESSYPAAKVPVRENERFGYTIALEDINEFCESNGINDMGYAVQQICDSSGINPSDVVFSVNEDSVIADQETSDFVLDIMQEGVPVVVAPISKNSIEYIMTDEAVDYYMQTGDGYLLEALANDDIEAFLEDRKPRKIGESNARRVSRTNSKSQQSNSQQQTTSTPPPAQQQSQPKNTAPAGDPPKAENSEEAGIFNAAKNAVRKGREHVAKLIASLNTKLKEWEDKGQAQDAGRFAKLRGYVSKIISYLTEKLHSFVEPSNK